MIDPREKINMTKLPREIIEDPMIKALTEELSSQFACHTIILYGSRARGQATPTSDYDIAGICKTSTKTRIARFDTKYQVFVDLFVYPENELNPLQEEHLCMHEGVIIKEKKEFGTNLLANINKAINEPPLIPDYELEVRRVWYQKMLTRASTRDIDGIYRHNWVLHVLIEDYFVFRSLRYLGPKKAFEYLKEHDIKVLQLYDMALNNADDLGRLEALIQAVTNTVST